MKFTEVKRRVVRVLKFHNRVSGAIQLRAVEDEHTDYVRCNKFERHQGKREMARRERQMARRTA